MDALKSPVVNLPQLGKSIEKAHILAETISTCLNEGTGEKYSFILLVVHLLSPQILPHMDNFPLQSHRKLLHLTLVNIHFVRVRA